MAFNILFVEDNINKRDDIINYINSLSGLLSNIKSVESIESALDYLERFEVNLLILDLNIPNRDNGNPITDGGITLLNTLDHDTEGEFNRPDTVYAITQHQKLLHEYSGIFKSFNFSINFYSPLHSEWKESLGKHIQWMAGSKKKYNNSSSSSKSVLISVHGIRTDGNWQEKLRTDVIEHHKEKIFYFSYNFGFFDLVRFFLPFTRNKEVNKFSEQIIDLLKDYPNNSVNFIGHSFGTYIIGYFLKSLSSNCSIKVDKVILMSSVLPSDFPWHKIRKKISINNIINECGTKDKILILSHMFIPGAGMAGRVGFKGLAGTDFINRFYDSGHNLYENVDDYFSRIFSPVLIKSEIKPFNSREGSWCPNFINSVISWLSTKNISIIILLIVIFIINKP
ncbi:response regulator [Leucothrix arctica]|uniref:Response regulatory domain-containing protein n=1 Tax=Leucothrix arctica TaxID=1481894 RepID=A0A317C512_9GAMM|nr:response regulator [Leucothrix arctica]PWQ93735.1 hypothetical protein DKT75_19185 [Leucothrix arctica]